VVKVLREGAAEGRYDLGSWVLMPNHVHVLLKPGDTLLREVAWIQRPNGLRGEPGHEAFRILLAKDYFDRWIRNRNEWKKVIRYIEQNPVKEGLCKSSEDWQWSSAHLKRD
jgi:putative DNA methylase